ncbi:FecR family protein [Pleomorphovibrio marinus]|uniref:FecR family protein n=1 Tax=Pleomorphovibrio marinus TaxID=2164132 RepID=UPI0018E5701B|nr:FecR family protein [Pleomorphovibrio marinus]
MDEFRDIDGKILKVLNGTASEEEREFVNYWVNESKNNAFQFQKLKGIWEERIQDSKLIGHEEYKKKIWRAFLSDKHSPKKIPVIPLYRRSWFRMAVVVAIMLFPIYSLYFQEEEVSEDEIPEVRLFTKSNPTGQKSLIQLPDGSKVWLNSDSRISYHEHFSDSLRAIKLEGEAYFEVVRDSLRPFVVDFESLTVTVLGTSFNISAFEAEKDLKVTLVDGSVKVSNSKLEDNLILEPGTGLVYSKEKNDYHEFSKHDNPELFRKTTGWKNGNLVFDGRNFEDFVREIKRWYGVQVQVKGTPPKGWNIRASFENELLTNVMDAVSYNKGFRYSLKDKELTIMFN